MMLILLIVLCLPSLVGAIPQACTALTVTKVDKYYGHYDSETDVSFKLSLSRRGNETWITVSDARFNQTDNAYPDYICANVPFGMNGPDPQKCSFNFTGTFSFSIEGPSFYLHARLSRSWYEIFWGYADDGTFSYPDGSLFTPETPSYTDSQSDRQSSVVETQTCTSFAPAPQAPVKAPRCLSFKGRTSILNADDNYSINATSLASYTFSAGNNLDANATFTGSPGHYIIYWINSDYPCERFVSASMTTA